jgi:DNA-binding XRE family transcriptional regulator
LTVEVHILKCNLRDRRKKAGITQEQLAQEVGVSKTRISEYENNNVNMTIITAKKLAAVCNCTIDDMFEFYVDRRRG